MSKVVMIQSAFTGGEVSPKLLARVDSDQYNRSCKTMTNALPFYHGGAKRRPGTFYIGEVRNSSFITKLVPFVYSRTQSYMCVFNNGYIQFIKDGEFVESSPAVRYELAHPYLSDELNEVRFAQFGNVVYFTHPNHAPKKLVRTSDTNWALTDITFIYNALTDYWYDNSNLSFQITSNATTYTAGSTFTVTSPGDGGTCTFVFAGTGYGQMVVASNPGSPAETWTVTCVYANSLRQEWSVVGSVSGSMAAQFTTGNYPAAIAFYQQRLFLGGTPLQPQMIWGSTSEDYINLTLGPDDKDGVNFTLANSSNDMILHMVGSPNNLLIMSYANEFIMESSSGIYTPKTANVKPQTKFGCNLVAPLRVGSDTVFIQRDGRRVRSISYDIESSSNAAKDITVISEHITGTGITDMSYQQSPDYVVWCVRKDGLLASLTYLDEQEVTAWSKHETDGSFLAVATIPENNTDRTYVVVEREIGGVQMKYIESIDYLLDSLTDSTIFGASVTAKTNWSGLDHLEGKTVSIVADGSNVTPKVVTGGEIDLDIPAFEVAIGLPYTTTIELLHPNPSNIEGGAAAGRKLSVNEVVLNLYETIGCRVNDVEVPFQKVGDLMDTAPEMFTGEKRVTTVGWRSPNNIKIEQDLPLPFTLLGVSLKVVIND